MVDAGARRALVDGGKSLLAAGVREVEGAFDADAPVEIVGDDGRVFAKGLCRYGASQLRAVAGKRTADLAERSPARGRPPRRPRRPALSGSQLADEGSRGLMQ